MKAHFIKNAKADALIDLQSPVWEQAIITQVEMSETPMAMQPTEAVRAQWKGKKHGVTDKVRIASIHNGSLLAFKLQWHVEKPAKDILDNDQFVDGVAIMLPSVAGAPILLMGMETAPVNAWYWRADEDHVGRHIVATGIGTTRTIDQNMVVCRSQFLDGEWTVTMMRPMLIDTKEPIAQLRAGEQLPYGIAIWAGNNQERAGVKSFTLSKEDLFIEKTN